MAASQVPRPVSTAGRAARGLGDRPVRVTKRRAETRARLLVAASEVFTEKGFGRTTVEDICDRAGYTRGAFYSNFDTLDELFFALYAERSSELIRVVGDAVAAATSTLAAGEGGEPALNAAMDRVVAALPVTRDQELLDIEFTAHALRNPEVATALAAHRRDLRLELIPLLRIGLGAVGVVANDHQLDQISRALMAGHDGMFVQELLEPDDPSLPILRHRVMTALLNTGLHI